jgi:hypothetical protein
MIVGAFDERPALLGFQFGALTLLALGPARGHVLLDSDSPWGRPFPRPHHRNAQLMGVLSNAMRNAVLRIRE